MSSMNNLSYKSHRGLIEFVYCLLSHKRNNVGVACVHYSNALSLSCGKYEDRIYNNLACALLFRTQGNFEQARLYQ